MAETAVRFFASVTAAQLQPGQGTNTHSDQLRASKTIDCPKIIVGNSKLSRAGVIAMRWRGWIVAAAMVAGCAGRRAVVSRLCRVCRRIGPPQPNLASLSGEACCSPTAMRAFRRFRTAVATRANLLRKRLGRLLRTQSPVQAWVNRIGAPSVRCYPVPAKSVVACASVCRASGASDATNACGPPAQPRPAVQPASAAEATRLCQASRRFLRRGIWERPSALEPLMSAGLDSCISASAEKIKHPVGAAFRRSILRQLVPCTE